MQVLGNQGDYNEAKPARSLQSER